jgi:hypothetical protein
MASRGRAGGEQGQATVEFVALLPLLGAVALLAWQAVVAGQAWWLAGAAAREGARAAAVGGDPARAVRGVLPGGLARGAHVSTERDGGVRVRVAVPVVVGGGRSLGSVGARARMEPQR